MSDSNVNKELDQYFADLRLISIHYCPLCRRECFDEDIENAHKNGLPLVCINCTPELKRQISLCAPLMSQIKF